MNINVSIITINYNSLADTLDLLDTIEASRKDVDLETEIIVVDNKSKEDPTNALLAYPNVKLIKSSSNLGFAGGNNLGIKASSGDYIFIVNNDAELHLSALKELIVQYKTNPEYGILTPVIKNEDQSIQFAGYTPVNKLTCRNKHLEKPNSTMGILESSYPHGAAMLISRENLNKIGLMSENYFLYYEELDWGTRMKDFGLKIGVCLSSEIVHKESASTGKVSQCKLYFMTRNRILYVRKHFSRFNKIAFALFFVLVSAPKSLLNFLWDKDWGSVRTFFEAILWNVRNPTTSTTLGYKFDNLLK